MKKLIQWLAGFFQDQSNSASSKRAVLYIFCYLFAIQVNASIGGAKTDINIMMATIGVILFCIGAVTAEFFNDYMKKDK